MAKKNRQLKVFLCDLTHDTQILVSDTIPINIGFIGSYAKKIFSDEIDLDLFKYPDTLFSALQSKIPDLIGFSNYSWNSRLSERFARYTKQLNPEVITVMGGTNFPQKKIDQEKYLAVRPEIGFHVYNEGEISFANLIERILTARDGGVEIYGQGVAGACFIDPESHKEGHPNLISGESLPRLKNLDEIPSPYLNGMLDKFFDGRLTPFIETNRGCPFTCSFCHTGHATLSKISRFSPERVREEIHYIGSRAKDLGISNLHLADTNFGMYTSDINTCAELSTSQTKFGWPTQIQATTGKNSKKRILEITKVMGPSLAINMSVQSMDAEVLRNIERSNISLDDYKEIHQTLIQQGRPSNGELIIGLPGESRESFIKGLRQVIDAGVTRVANYTLMLLYGTQFKDPKYREKYSIDGKYRLVPLNFGDYMGEKVFDIEEVGIATNTMSFEDYLWLRGLCLFTEVLYNNKPFYPLFRYMNQKGLQQYDFILHLYEKRNSAPASIKRLVESFEKETRSELWETEEQLVEFYSNGKNYKKLIAGEVGGNLIYKYKAISLAHHSSGWVEFMRVQALNWLKDADGKAHSQGETEEEVTAVSTYSALRLEGVLEARASTSTLKADFEYDILEWLSATENNSVPLSKYKRETGVTYEFSFSAQQIKERKEFFRRYGEHINALSKIVARVTNVEQLFRTASTQDAIYSSEKVQSDEMVRYAISN